MRKTSACQRLPQTCCSLTVSIPPIASCVALHPICQRIISRTSSSLPPKQGAPWHTGTKPRICSMRSLERQMQARLRNRPTAWQSLIQTPAATRQKPHTKQYETTAFAWLTFSSRTANYAVQAGSPHIGFLNDSDPNTTCTLYAFWASGSWTCT